MTRIVMDETVNSRAFEYTADMYQFFKSLPEAEDLAIIVAVVSIKGSESMQDLG